MLLFAVALVPAGQDLVLSASCGPGCDPTPTPFTIPAGHRAVQFRVQSLRPGEPCAGSKAATLAGFSIRRGSDTVIVYYKGPRGVVSDPVPIESLVLEPGSYALLSVPANGATVTLGCALSSSQEK